jgi:hypothetical protein
MRGHRERSGSLFSYVSIEERIPASHPLRRIRKLALKATVLLLLTLLIKAKVRITAFSAIGFFLLMLQTLVFLAVSGGIVVAAGGAALYAAQQRKGAAA